jgi:hypothetical protein
MALLPLGVLGARKPFSSVMIAMVLIHSETNELLFKKKQRFFATGASLLDAEAK